MCVVLTTSQCFAIKGGPFGGGSGKVSTTGTYAGVMFAASHVPLCCADSTGKPVSCSSATSTGTPKPCSNQPTGLNQIGLFSLPIPKTGIGSGTAILFEQGQIYTGTIQASADPDSAKVTGIFSASFPYVFPVETGKDAQGNPIFTIETVIAQASGKLDAKVRASTKSSSLGSIRLKGTADVQFALTVNNPFDEIIFTVSGFKQASL